MKINHNYYSNLAFNYAEINLGKTKDNPSVGCIVVKNNCVISSGFTSLNGRPHAEYNALKKKNDYKNSNLYVTLEPCTHYGKTQPCTKLIKKKKIKKVYYCFNDPDKRTFKKAKKELKKSNINLIKIQLKNNNFYKSYFLNKTKKLPLVDAKIAVSKDFFTINKKSKWITSYKSRKVTHLLRSRYDAIISTSKSINKDNSLLNCRIKGLNNYKPDLIIIDRKLKLKNNLKLFKFSKKRKIYIITTTKNKKKITNFRKKNIKVINLLSLVSINDFLKLFKTIFKLGKRRIFIETGLSFLNLLIKFKLINDLFLFKSSKMLKNNGNNYVTSSYIRKLNFNNKIKVNLNGDNLYKIKMN